MTGNLLNTFNLGFPNKHFELKVSENISPVDLNVKIIAIFQTNMSPGHHDEIYERNKLSFEHCSAQQYCKKPILQALSIFVNFSHPFILYSFFCISVAVLLKCFIILKVGLVEIYNIVPLSLKYWTSIPETVTSWKPWALPPWHTSTAGVSHSLLEDKYCSCLLRSTSAAATMKDRNNFTVIKLVVCQ